jgi:AAA family ATP:ADP antiporter
MSDSSVRRLLSPILTLREGEAATAVMMFIYSFLVMTAYNNIKPSATGKFIADVGADNLPWVMLVAGVGMGVIMQYYSRLVGRVPRLWVLPGTQVVVVGTLVAFWFLFQTGSTLVSVAFYFWGRLLVGIFLISQFWTLANDIYDPRQAKRIFGFIGGGASLGGMTGAGLTSLLAERVGAVNLILFSAGLLVLCFFLVILIQRRTHPREDSSVPQTKETVGGGEALAMLRQSKHLRLISLVIGFAALGAVTIEQQLNMAAEQFVQGEDGIVGFLGKITFYLSAISFVIQVYFTSRIHRILGIGFALMVLPVSLGATALLILFNPVLWSTMVARITDTSLRYSLDKTTREVLFQPLPKELKLKAKSFVDVTADRFIGKGVGSVLLLILLKVVGVTWVQLSFLSLTYCVLWLFLARKARHEYTASFRRSIEQLEIEPAAMKPQLGDATTVETLVEELGSPEEHRVLYAIDLLDSLDKRNLVTPLLLHHASPAVRARALAAIESARPDLIERWLPAVERVLKDESADVRAAAVSALATIRKEEITELMRPYLDDPDPRIVAAAAVALAGSASREDVDSAEAALRRLASDTREAAAEGRRQVARAVAQIQDPSFRSLLIPLMYDADIEVAKEAIGSVSRLGTADYMFVPSLVSLLRHRRLKNIARRVLVSYGEGMLDALAYFMKDPDENPWVRRHIPGTLALIPSQRSVDILLEALVDDDGFIRYKAVTALGRLRREHPELVIEPEPIQKLALRDALRFYRYLGIHYNLFEKEGLAKDSLIGRTVEEKMQRAMDRLYGLLGLIYPWKDMVAARWTLEHGEARSRASATEYLDNMLSGDLRKRLMPIIEDMPMEEKVRKGNVFLKTRVRGVEETLTRLIYDDDPVVAATAIDLVRERKLWSLADDIEEVLAFRDAKDFVVFEAASFALAAHRLGEERPHAV